jgi:phosphate transport system permease protein
MPETPPAAPENPRRRRVRITRTLDRAFLIGTGIVAVLSATVFVAIAIQLIRQSYTTIVLYGPGFVVGTQWNINTNTYGALPFIDGTLETSAVAMLLGIPVSLGIAIFLSEETHGALGMALASLVELLAAIPSVVYGFWALFILVPVMHYQVDPALHQWLGPIPGLGALFPAQSTGLGILTSGIILSVMVIPTISAVSRETMSTVPRAQREAALALGATRWETTRRAVLPYARTGIIGGIVLGLGRALGETMAVTMTIGNQNQVPTSLFSQGQSIASAIANNFPEFNTPAETSALLEVAVILLIITALVNLFARALVRGLVRGPEVVA